MKKIKVQLIKTFIFSAGADKKKFMEEAYKYIRDMDRAIKEKDRKMNRLKKAIEKERNCKRIAKEIMKEMI